MSETSREHRQAIAATLTVAYGTSHPMTVDETFKVYVDFVSRLNKVENKRTRKIEDEEEEARDEMHIEGWPDPLRGVKASEVRSNFTTVLNP